MHRQITFFWGSLLLLFTIAGCDSFSLLNQFKHIVQPAQTTQPNPSLNLVLQKSSVKPGEECILYPGGGTEPYAYAVIVDDLFDAGYADDPGAIANQIYTAGASIGTVKIRLSDSAGSSAEALLTILPWKPQNFIVDDAIPAPHTITLTWTYDEPGYIGRFRILRSVAGGSFNPLANIGSAIRSYTDTMASPHENIYRLYAVAGEYVSVYAEGSGFGLR